jgi:hypothetical protein
MDDFNVDQFCEDLPGDVLIVGDSISHQHWQVLVKQLRLGSKKHRAGTQLVSTSTPCWYPYLDKAHLVEESVLCWGSKITRKVTHIRNDWAQVHDPDGTWKPNPQQCRMSRDDSEVDREEYNATADQMEEAARPVNAARLLPWDFPQILSRFKVFIFNSGAHYHPDEDHRENVQGVLDLFQRHPEIDKRYVFWRTTMQGVNNCEAMDGKPPFPSLEAAEKHYGKNPWYEGADFKRQNDIATSMWAKHGFPLIDVYKSSMMNGHSGHSGRGLDCLHYVLDGPGGGYVYEHWNRILYNLIRRRAGSHP